MEKIINKHSLQGGRGDDMVKVLIATIYNADAVLLACNRLGPDRLILLADKEGNKKQEEGITRIMDSLGRVIEVKVQKVPMYDIVGTAAKVAALCSSISS